MTDHAAPAAARGSSQRATPRRPGALRVHLRVVDAMLRREMSTRYGATTGGYIWAVAEPVGMIAVLSFAFSLLSRSPDLGQSFIVFFASGYLAFGFFRAVSILIGVTVKANRNLLRYPTVTIYDGVIARFLLSFLTHCMVTAVLMIGSIWLTGEPVRIDLAPIFGAMAAGAALGLGIGMINAALFPLYPVYQKMFTIVTRPLFIVSGVIYTPESMPRMVQEILWYNPIVHVVSLFRTGFYPVYNAYTETIEYTWAWALVTLFAGLLLIRKFRGRLADI